MRWPHVHWGRPVGHVGAPFYSVRGEPGGTETYGTRHRRCRCGREWTCTELVH